jgi:hypothetical protein
VGVKGKQTNYCKVSLAEGKCATVRCDLGFDWALLENIPPRYISNQLDVTFSKLFQLFLQLYLFRAFLALLQDLVFCIGSCWLDK